MSHRPNTLPGAGSTEPRGAAGGGGGSAHPNPSGMTTLDPIRVAREYLWWVVGASVIGAVLGLIAFLVLVRMVPVYAYSATFKLNLPPEDVTQVTATRASDPWIERELETQAQRMTSVSILRAAITSSSTEMLSTSWIKQYQQADGNLLVDEALADLRGRISARPVRKTLYIRLSIRGDTTEDLKRVLNAVITVYEQQLTQELIRYTEDNVQEWRAAKAESEDEKRSIDRLIKTRLQELGLSHSINLDPVREEVQLLTERLTEYREQLASLTTEAEGLAERQDDPNTVFNDEEIARAEANSQIQSLENELVSLQAQLRAMRPDLGPNHRTIRDIENQIAARLAEKESKLHEVLVTNLRIRLDTVTKGIESIKSASIEAESTLGKRNEALAAFIDADNWIAERRSQQSRLDAQIEKYDQLIKEAEQLSRQSRSLTGKFEGPPNFDGRIFPKASQCILLGMFLFGGLTTGIVFLREFTDRRIKGPGDITLLPHGNVLGVIPHLSEDPANPRRIELISRDAPDSIMAESIRQIRNPLMRGLNDADHKTILVVGGHPGAGTSAFISNLAVSFANSEKKVLIIDANFRRPKQADIFGVQQDPGLGDVISGMASFEQATRATAIPGVSLLPAGSPEHQIFERLSTDQFATMLATARAAYDIVLVDAPAAVVAGDSLVLANHVDATVLLVRAMQEERGLVARLIGQLRSSRAQHLGIVLNAVRSSAGGYLKRNYQQMDAYRRSSAE